MEKQTTINGYLVELHGDFDGSTVDCFVSKDGHSASLAAVECEMALNDGGSKLKVSSDDFNKMVEWAITNGY